MNELIKEVGTIAIAGLSKEDYKWLDSGTFCYQLTLDQKRLAYDAMRQKYADNRTALKQVDKFDPESLYRKQLSSYRLALLSQDTDRIAVLDAWFDAYNTDS